jgi:hypothetical protein
MSNTLHSISMHDLAAVFGGMEPSEPRNYQKDVIGVSAGGADVGMSREQWRSDYGMCMENASKQGWSAAETKDACGRPPRAP